MSLQHTRDSVGTPGNVSLPPPSEDHGSHTMFSSFWRERLVEIGMIVSMALYYVVGNNNLTLPGGSIAHLNPLYSLPFLLAFAVLCWYRLPLAVALLPLALPYYLLQKPVLRTPHAAYDFSLIEIALWTCILVAVLQLALHRRKWAYWLSWSEWRDRLGPFVWPILVFFVMAAFSIVVAYEHATALRAFREEVLDPLLYLVLALACLRERRDLVRLLAALVGTALVISLLAIVQYVFFKNTLVLESDGIRRVHTVYGSANSIGLLLDYTLPIGLAWFLLHTTWRVRIVAGVVCLPLLAALYLSQSHGAWIAITVAALFVLAFTIRSRRVLLIGAGILLALIVIVLLAFPHVLQFIFEGHTNQHDISTLQKRLYLWQSALLMIRDHAVFGVGMDNWLCYYSKNTICNAHAFHYWIVTDPQTGLATGLRDEPTLSHPHNIFLHVWVSMGIFGLLAFLAVIGLFGRLFVHILQWLRTLGADRARWRWMVVGLGAAMLAALVQGMGDSAFLEQDLAFCFWMLVTALLLARWLIHMPWKNTTSPIAKL